MNEQQLKILVNMITSESHIYLDRAASICLELKVPLKEVQGAAIEDTFKEALVRGLTFGIEHLIKAGKLK